MDPSPPLVPPPLVLQRYKELKEQREAKSHDLELISTRINQSSHHQQLVELQALKDTVGVYGGGMEGVATLDTTGIRCGGIMVIFVPLPLLAPPHHHSSSERTTESNRGNRKTCKTTASGHPEEDEGEWE